MAAEELGIISRLSSGTACGILWGITPSTRKGNVMANYRRLRDEARAYYALVERAQRAGVPTSLDDPRSARTVEGLRRAVERAEASR